MSAQFWGRFPLVCFHPGAHSLLGCGTSQTPGPTAEPATAPHPPAPSWSQRPPGHLPEPGSASHRPRWWGTPWRPTWSAGQRGRGVPLQGRRGGPVEVESWQLGSHGGADPPQRAGRQVVSVSDVLLSLLVTMICRLSLQQPAATSAWQHCPRSTPTQ